MNSAGSSTTSGCGCDDAAIAATTITNDPGLPTLSYRVGTYASFLGRMLSQIHSPRTLANPPAGSWALAALGTRSPDDPAIALMDAWAVVADVLTFYQERIANEGFLGTAAERLSVLYLAQAIGYSLSPGVAASTFLALTIEDVIGTPAAPTLPQAVRSPSVQTQGSITYNPGVALIPKGTAVRSQPANGGLPQTFETEADLLARPAWNILLPRQTRPADLALTPDGRLWLLGSEAGFAPGSPVTTLYPSNTFLLHASTPPVPGGGVLAVSVQEIYVQGLNTGLATGDWLLLTGRNSLGATTAHSLRVWAAAALPSIGQTRIELGALPTAPSFAPAAFPAGGVPAMAVAFNRDNLHAYVLGTSIEESELETLMTLSGWDPAQVSAAANAVPADPSGTGGLFSFAAKLGFFGHNAPRWKATSTPSALRGDPAPHDWDAANGGNGQTVWTDSQGVYNTDAHVFLERTVDGILSGDWMMIGAPAQNPVPFAVSAAAAKSLADYGLSGKATGLSLASASQAPLQAFGSPAASFAGSAWIDLFTIGNDGHLHHQGGRNGAWMPTVESLGGPAGGSRFSAAPACVSGGPSPVEIFTISDDGNLWHAGWSGSYWWSPLSLGGSGVLTGTPSVVTNNGNPIPGNPLDVVATGTDGNLYHFWFINNRWQGPESLGKAGANVGWAGSPIMVNRGSSYLEIFGVGSDGYLYHAGCATGYKWFNGLPVLPTGGPIRFSSRPAVCVGPTPGRTGMNTTDVFGIGLDGILYHAWFDLGVGWQGTSQGGGFVYENLGGGFLVNSPCVVGNGPSPLEVFAIGSDGNLYHTWWTNGRWYGLESLGGGGALTGSPAAVLHGPNPIDVFAAARDGSLWHAWFDGKYWYTPENVGQGNLQPFPVRKSTAYVGSTALALAEYPVVDDLAAAAMSLMLNGLVLGLKAGMAVALSGVRADAPGIAVQEVLLLAGVVHTGGYTVLRFTTGMQFSYQRASLTVTANVVAATQGGSISAPELLGSGDATQPNQGFVLKQSALTYVSAATSTGTRSTLEVRVNDLLWTEQPSLYGLAPDAPVYALSQSNEGVTTVRFGDGVSGARVPTGINNITATYRLGLGRSGNLEAGVISVLQSRHAGVRGAANPLAASGGADAEDLQTAAAHAPRSVFTLDRVVSLSDYQHFAEAFAGIGKAQAVPLLVGSTSLVLVSVSGVAGAAVSPTSELYTSLVSALLAAHDPLQQFRLASYRPALFNLNASLILDTPRYVAADVMLAVGAALTATFAFDQRAFGQPVTAAEVVAAIQALPGVIAVDLNQLYRTDDSTGPAQTEPRSVLSAAPASVLAGKIVAAELLLLNARGVTLTVSKP